MSASGSYSVDDSGMVLTCIFLQDDVDDDIEPVYSTDQIQYFGIVEWRRADTTNVRRNMQDSTYLQPIAKEDAYNGFTSGYDMADNF